MGHDHEHGPGHGQGHHQGHGHASPGRAFAIGMAMNVAYVLIEAFYGFAAHALSLLADAGHNLGDVLGLALSWGAVWLAGRRGGGRFTYGMRRATVLAALANALILVLVTGGILWGAMARLITPQPAAGLPIIVVAAVGIAVNGLCAALFAAGRKGDLNLRGAFAHMASDAVVSAGVVLAGLVILRTGWLRVDPAVSLVVSLVILAGTWGLLRDSVLMALDAVPRAIDRGEVDRLLRGLPGVIEVHDLHIWSLGTTSTALTAHLVRPGHPVDDGLLLTASALLRERHGIDHATIQVEIGDGATPCGLRPGRA